MVASAVTLIRYDFGSPVSSSARSRIVSDSRRRFANGLNDWSVRFSSSFRRSSPPVHAWYPTSACASVCRPTFGFGTVAVIGRSPASNTASRTPVPNCGPGYSSTMAAGQSQSSRRMRSTAFMPMMLPAMQDSTCATLPDSNSPGG